MKLHGVDFTSAPSRRKGITIASGQMEGDVLRLESLQTLSDFTAFDSWLMQAGPWLAGFDLPFSLPRELVEYLYWPTSWPDLMRHMQTQTRAELRLQFKAFCDARAVGNKFAHRATDIPAGSSPSMKWVNPPVAYMLHAGAPRLLDAGVSIPGMYEGDPQRIALEAYPGMVARSVTKASYKSDDKSKQTPERQQKRELIVTAMEAGATPWKIKLDLGSYKTGLIADGSADLLDAVLCMLLAAWAWQRREDNYGLPEFDALEGWIAGA
ncbi:MAG: DUF429 domain-containing protein [Undibacterium umbellatum]|uniref:DUF429 domain-containing protein n=1 Tax=Undibacterium umbellatum TaxID=2762300 RepID=UPI003BB66C68